MLEQDLYYTQFNSMKKEENVGNTLTPDFWYVVSLNFVNVNI